MEFCTPLKNEPGCTNEQPEGSLDYRSPVTELLWNQAGMQPACPVYHTYNHFIQMFLMHSRVHFAPEGHRGWFPGRRRSIGIFAVRMDCAADNQYYQLLTNFTHKDWCAFLNEFPIYEPADRLALSPEHHAIADRKPNGELRYKSIWLRHEWEWVRILEENPGLHTRTYKLSEVFD